MVVVLIALKPAQARHIRGCGPPNVFLLPSFIGLQSPEWAATRFLIQFGFMFSCFLTSSGRGNNIYATAGWSLYKATILMMERSQDKCPHPRHRETKIQYSDAGVILNIWRCEDVMYTWLPIHDMSSTCEVTISDILCVLRGLLLALIYNIHTEKTTHGELYFHFSIFRLVSESERGNLHYDKVAISRDLLAQSDLVTGPCIMYEQQSWPNTRARAGAEEGFCNKYFCADKKKIDHRFGF